jgi:hypothetical protein
MSHLIQKYGNVGENPNFGQTGTTWTNPEFALLNDSQFASTTFSLFAPTSNYLYLRDFQTSLESTAEVVGIEVTVRRRAIGPVIDDYIGLVYGDPLSLNVTESKATEEEWGSLNVTVVYGGPTDTWGRSWTIAELNTENFGVVLSASGNGSSGNKAEIDYARIDIYYRVVTTDVTSGGIDGGGDGFYRASFRRFPTGIPPGVVAAGHVGILIDETTSGGIYGGGSVWLKAETMSGGSVVHGSTTNQVIYSVAKKTYEFYATGAREVPPDTEHPSVVAVAYVDLVGTSLTGTIHHNMTTPDAVRFRGNADESSIAGTILPVEVNFGVTSPINFNYTLTAQQATDVGNKLWYLYMLHASSGTHIRGQLMNYENEISGAAVVENFFSPLGGVFGGSSATMLVLRNEIPTSGARCSGSALVNWTINLNSISGNAARIGRSVATEIVVVYAPLLITGSLSGGAATVLGKYSPVVGTLGPLSGGQAVRQLTVPIGAAGVVAAGLAEWSKAVIYVGSGGCFAAGSYALQQTYAPQPTLGGVRIVGSWIGEKLKPLISARHLNYALVMGTPNILNTAEEDENQLISPYGSPESDPLKEDPYRIRHETGYCDFGETCDFPYLPAIVKNRQGVYLPAKNPQ